MHGYESFHAAFGGGRLLRAVALGWVFKTSSAPLGIKIGLPTILALLACYTPRTIAPMMGLPYEVAFDNLPENVLLLALVPHDRERVVDVWVRTPGEDPRAYRVKFSDKDRPRWKEAQEKIADNQPVYLMIDKAARGAHFHLLKEPPAAKKGVRP